MKSLFQYVKIISKKLTLHPVHPKSSHQNVFVPWTDSSQNIASNPSINLVIPRVQTQRHSFLTTNWSLKLKQWNRYWLLVASLTGTILLGIPQQAKADINDLQLNVSQDGTAPFTGPDPTFSGTTNSGNDASNNNGIVRTYDTVVYEIVYTTNVSPTNNPVFTVTIQDDDHIWDSNQPNCPSTTVSNDGKTLTCSTSVGISETGRIQLTARVKGTAEHGATLQAKASVTIDGTPVFTDIGPTTVRVSATPKMDLVKDRPGNPRRVGKFTAGPNGEEGVLYVWPLAVYAPQGSEDLGDADPNTPGKQIVITDVVWDGSQGVSANARLYTWGGRVGCAPNTGSSSILGTRIRELPYGTYNNSNPQRSVQNSGTWSCTQASPGQPITITITDADTTGLHKPTEGSNGNTLDADKTYLISGGVEIWIPTSDFGSSNSLTVINRYNFLDAPSVTGQTNIEPDKGTNTSVPLSDNDSINNDRTFTLEKPTPGGFFQKYYRNTYDGSENFGNGNILYPMTAVHSGDGVVMPDQVFGSRVRVKNDGTEDLNNVILCDKIDNRTQVVAPHPTTGTIVQIRSGGNRLSSSEVIIEYGIGGDDVNTNYYGSDSAAIDDSARYTAQRNATCSDNDSRNSTWYTDISQVPGGAAAVTRVRLRPSASDGVLPETKEIEAVIHLKALATDPETNSAIPNGNLLANQAGWRTDDLSSGSWRLGNYNPVNDTGGRDGDRLRLTRAIVRVTKKTDDSTNSSPADDSINTVQAQENVTFVLEPTLTAFVDDGPSAKVIVTDTLPKELKYVANSASVAPTSVTENGDGTTTIVWDLGNKTPNNQISPITFQAQVNFDANGGSTTTNTVFVQALGSSNDDLDSSSVADRTATRSINIINNAAFVISKDTPKPEINSGEQVEYRLYLANLSSEDIPAGSQFIDILPFPGDSSLRNPLDDPLTPPTGYIGNLLFSNIIDTSSIGFTFEYTKENPANIKPDPNDTSNQNGGTTTWCNSFSGGSCPANNTEVTAIRITMPEFPAGNPTRQLKITMDTSNNTGSNIYTNNFTGQPVGLGVITSVDATVRTIASDPNVLLVKRITAINGDRTKNPNDNTPLNTFVDDTTSSQKDNDNHSNWPSGYLLGELDAGKVEPGDEIEYTIYFLNAGDRNANDVRICDRITPNQDFQGDTYGTGKGIQLRLGTSAAIDLTNTNDTSDRAELIAANSAVSSSCNLKATNDNGTLVIDITGSGNTIQPDLTTMPGSTGQGAPNDSYGFIRFVTKVQSNQP